LFSQLLDNPSTVIDANVFVFDNDARTDVSNSLQTLLGRRVLYKLYFTVLFYEANIELSQSVYREVLCLSQL